ncbi:MAG: type II toxin-antitoxin system PemK/MazF family toxin [Alphaproteobacteria bacterium]|nr:type II toxin-antitoxin system PemK/MazF family toxin [Alphaproteobacteria bacterium]
MTYNRWDVVAVDFPFVEGMDSKRRPGLIVSAARLHDTHKIYWIVMISSADAGARTDDILVTDPEKAGLPVKCAIRVARLAAISESLINRRLGAISAKDRAAVVGLLKKFAP